MVNNLPEVHETQIQSLGLEDPLNKGMATHSSILAWRILWTEEPGRLQSTGSKIWTWLSGWHFSPAAFTTIQFIKLPESLVWSSQQWDTPPTSTLIHQTLDQGVLLGQEGRVDKIGQVGLVSESWLYPHGLQLTLSYLTYYFNYPMPDNSAFFLPNMLSHWCKQKILEIIHLSVQ